MRNTTFLFIFFGLIVQGGLRASTITDGEIHQVYPKAGDGIEILLARYELSDQNGLKKEFLKLNNLNNKAHLYTHKKYKLPIYLYNYNGKSIRTTIGIGDWEKAVRIKEYNELLYKKGVRSTHFVNSNILWVPFTEISLKTDTVITKSISTRAITKVIDTPKKANILKVRAIKDNLYGANYSSIEVLDQSLKDRVFYVVSGHGGPDPGAVCDDCSAILCEDEYAYDVSLRLARNLRQHGAKVEMVIQDKNDGIRDKKILKCDASERLADGSKLPDKHLPRLQQRTSYINKKYKKYKKQGYKDQVVISLHIDSNSKSLEQDVFFCYYKGSKASRKLAIDIRDKFEEKYKQHQKSRGYKGYLHQRNIYVLRATSPPAVLIELANIKNKYNHKRILQSDNRQALANWIFEGLTGFDPAMEQGGMIVLAE